MFNSSYFHIRSVSSFIGDGGATVLILKVFYACERFGQRDILGVKGSEGKKERGTSVNASYSRIRVRICRDYPGQPRRFTGALTFRVCKKPRLISFLLLHSETGQPRNAVPCNVCKTSRIVLCQIRSITLVQVETVSYKSMFFKYKCINGINRKIFNKFLYCLLK